MKVGYIDLTTAVKLHGRWVVPIGAGQSIHMTDAQYLGSDDNFYLRPENKFGVFIRAVYTTELASRLGVEEIDYALPKLGLRNLLQMNFGGMFSQRPELRDFGLQPIQGAQVSVWWKPKKRTVLSLFRFNGNFDFADAILEKLDGSKATISTNLREVKALRLTKGR